MRKMKNQSVTIVALATVLSALALVSAFGQSVTPNNVSVFATGLNAPSPAVQADDGRSIVGLWRVHYFHGTVELFQTFDQWHSDGQEFEVAALAPGAVCQGTFKQTENGTIQLFHVGWNFDQNGLLTGYFKETQTNTVGHDGNTYHGKYDIKNYDTSGNVLNEDTGTLRATRLSVH
jgi:hypothetical protein